MRAITDYWHRYHPMVHLLMLGTVVITLTNSMSLPFLAIYLRNTSGLDYAMIGLIIGAGPVAGTIGGFVGGILSDFFGRPRLMLASLLLLGIAFFGFVLVEHPLLLLLFSVLKGVGAAFFGTISKALMGDLTPEELRFRMFANRYFAVNLGFSIGPILGAFLGIGGGSLGFVLAAAVYLIYALVLAVAFRVTAVPDRPAATETIRLSSVLAVLRHDRILLLFIVGSILVMAVHGQMSVTLSQYLQDHFTEGVQMLGVLMSVNGLTVLLAQIPVTRMAERIGLFQRLALGCLLFALGEIGFAYSMALAAFVLAMIIFTIGEILIIPSEYALIDEITPSGMRGTYYGAQSLNEFGNFLGPWIGGLFLSLWGGKALFFLMAAFSLGSLLFFWAGRRLAIQRGRTMDISY